MKSKFLQSKHHQLLIFCWKFKLFGIIVTIIALQYSGLAFILKLFSPNQKVGEIFTFLVRIRHRRFPFNFTEQFFRWFGSDILYHPVLIVCKAKRIHGSVSGDTRDSHLTSHYWGDRKRAMLNREKLATIVYSVFILSLLFC